jgi:hypothetical protein
MAPLVAPEKRLDQRDPELAGPRAPLGSIKLARACVETPRARFPNSRPCVTRSSKLAEPARPSQMHGRSRFRVATASPIGAAT